MGTNLLHSVTIKRWVPRRKAEIVAAVHSGALSLEEACHRYMLTADEFASWEKSFERYGRPGLRITRIQDYRMRSIVSRALFMDAAVLDHGARSTEGLCCKD